MLLSDKKFSCVSPTISFGIELVSLLLSKEREVRLLKSPIDVGIAPVKEFVEISSFCKLRKEPKLLGNGPFNLLL